MKLGPRCATKGSSLESQSYAQAQWHYTVLSTMLCCLRILIHKDQRDGSYIAGCVGHQPPSVSPVIEHAQKELIIYSSRISICIHTRLEILLRKGASTTTTTNIHNAGHHYAPPPFPHELPRPHPRPGPRTPLQQRGRPTAPPPQRPRRPSRSCRNRQHDL